MRKPTTICVIDDDRMYTLILGKQLKATSCCDNLLVFHHGLAAWEYFSPLMALAERLPDIILLDLNMPVMDGWQFLDEFSQLKPAKPITIYIVSSSIDPADHQKAATYPAVAHFYIKPISRNDLAAIVGT
ncbi:response regulator [Spirosoma rhododendri]|uniref:Response regulator n=1 Tax=Spirosoma rhododendri TaxID=2728024 RepID=A0A7L5DYN1_9BACT|nr:response regulator [Spirosoma rhododendri]QJD81708.1 response regulator [Spirosoma rhododendri]